VKSAKAIFESRGNSPRLFRNTLVFLAVDKTRLQDLDEAVRKFLAWESILAEKEPLDLSPHQVKQAETQKTSADGAVKARLPESYQWLIVPVQNTPQATLDWQAIRLSGTDSLAVRASKKLRNDELLVTALAGTVLKTEMDKVPLWRGSHVEIKQLAEDFARYPYLPRLRGPEVLVGAVRDGLGLLLWRQESFAYADTFDEEAGRYRGLRGGQIVALSADSLTGLLVKPEVAVRQQTAETPPAPGTPTGVPPTGPTGGETIPSPHPQPQPQVETGPKRFHGTVVLDSTRTGRDAGQIADEVISHLAGLVGSKVTVTLEIEAEIPEGTPENVVRTVTENCRTLKFTSQGFEEE
jgi:hypothetical protein